MTGAVRQRHILPTMRAFAIDRFGEPGTLRKIPTAHAGADKILIRVHAADVNPIDWQICEGRITVALPE